MPPIMSCTAPAVSVAAVVNPILRTLKSICPAPAPFVKSAWKDATAVPAVWDGNVAFIAEKRLVPPNWVVAPVTAAASELTPMR